MKFLVSVFFLAVLSISSAFAEDSKNRFFELEQKKQKLKSCNLVFKSMFGKENKISAIEKESCKKHSIGSIYFIHQDGTMRPMNPLK